MLLSWFGGQEYGDAVADILLGLAEPGGRLPTTWPGEQADVPVIDVTPFNGVVSYDEGIHIGYRAWLKAGPSPPTNSATVSATRPGPSTTSHSTPRRSPRAARSRAAVRVTNTGARVGKQVVQLYASRETSAIDRPVRWLVGFAAVRVEPGESAWPPFRCRLAPSPTGAWIAGDPGWHYEPGVFRLHAGTSVSALALAKSIELTA